MSEQEPEAKEIVTVAQDLTAIEDLATRLKGQAEHKANATIDGTGLPGGLAMVALGPDASPDEWAEQIAAAEFRHYAECGRENHKDCTIAGAEHVEDEDDDSEPVLQTLLFWSEEWRREHKADYGKRPTIASEAGFIRYLLPWAWENELHWTDFADDIKQARVRLENLLYAGWRANRGRVTCTNTECEKKPRLIRVYGTGDHPDTWKCGACKWRYDDATYLRMLESQARSEAAQRYVQVREAIDLLRSRGTTERTARRWIAPFEHTEDRCSECGDRWEPREYPVCPAERDGEKCGGMLMPVWTGDAEAIPESYCDLTTRRQLVWWPTLWTRHLLRSARRKAAA